MAHFFAKRDQNMGHFFGPPLGRQKFCGKSKLNKEGCLFSDTRDIPSNSPSNIPSNIPVVVRANQECIATIWCLCTKTNELRKKGVRERQDSDT